MTSAALCGDSPVSTYLIPMSSMGLPSTYLPSTPEKMVMSLASMSSYPRSAAMHDMAS